MLLFRTSSIQSSIIRQLFKISANTAIMNERLQWVHYYTGPETSPNDICNQFSKYEGGKVELFKNDETGVATVRINHPERRNALSGRKLDTSVNI